MADENVGRIATAYAVTKALLPLRLLLSVWATPWFAKATLLPIWRVAKRTVAKGTNSKPGPSAAAGTGAIGGGAIAKK